MTTRPHSRAVTRWRSLALLLLIAFNTTAAPPAPKPLPRLIQKDGRYALMVDGAPYLLLGAQVHNSSAWPAVLPAAVWPAMKALHVNTVEMPVYWEQMEPEPGHFDFAVVDELVRQARAHQVRLVLLWFGTWKNGSNHYMPAWMKRQPALYPNITGQNGQPIDSPSPHAPATLVADIRAFTAFMSHLKIIDAARTVIMVQVENEPGTWGGIRDFSPAAQRLFEAPVPARLLAGLGQPVGAGSWRTVFGDDADEFFHAWFIADFIGQVAAAGKAAYPLPLYTNAALRDPLHASRPPAYESGGPTDNVLRLWKIAAPALDLLAPDIYMDDDARYRRVLELYHRPDNALLVPETGSQASNARYFYATLGQGGIGFAPFGLDFANYADTPAATSTMTAENLAAFALNNRTFAPMAREVARLNFEGKLQAVAEAPPTTALATPALASTTATATPAPAVAQVAPPLVFDGWEATVSYGPRNGSGANTQPVGRAMVAQLGPDEFLVTGAFARVNFRPTGAAAGRVWQFLRVEEGQYEQGVFQPVRTWNGDETDWGLQFSSGPQVLRVRLYTR